MEEVREMFSLKTSAMNRFRPRLGNVFFKILALLEQATDEDFEQDDSQSGSEVKLPSIEWKRKIVLSFITAGFVWKDGKKFPDAVAKLREEVKFSTASLQVIASWWLCTGGSVHVRHLNETSCNGLHWRQCAILSTFAAFV
mmetsp:Transcript_33944/g.76302  ORF Transcript_33944/g.76302 Transcript_33944/m.76302 type:complete len:141 (-) Transcript_33944:552-974(-)